jgi:hypothetical protein
MLVFALGTLPTLLIIGFTSSKLSQNPKISSMFLKVAGIFVLFLAILNISSSLNILGLPSLSNVFKKTNAQQQTSQIDLPPIVDGKQVIKMTVTASSFEPNTFVVQKDIPVLWEITDGGVSGCTSSVISKDLMPGKRIEINQKQVTAEFTPTKVGTFKFSCGMGMALGSITVVDQNASTQEVQQAATEAQNSTPAGGGCGCGGGGAGGCGGGGTATGGTTPAPASSCGCGGGSGTGSGSANGGGGSCH